MALKDEFDTFKTNPVAGLGEEMRRPPSPERLAAQQANSARLSGLPDAPVRPPAGPMPAAGPGRIAARISGLASETAPRVGGFSPGMAGASGLREALNAPPSPERIAAQQALNDRLNGIGRPPMNPALAGLREETFRPPSPERVAAQQALNQRLAGLGGPEPIRVAPAAAPAGPQAWYNRPVGGIIRSAADATGQGAGRAAGAAQGIIARNAGTLGRMASVGGKAAPIIGAAMEGVNVAQDAMTPGMTGLDKTARVAEGVGRFAGGAAGMAGGAALGAMTGPLAPVAVPLGALAGGIVGAAAPNLVNKAYNAVTGNDNQLASDKAAGLRSAAEPPKSPIAAMAATAPNAPRAGTSQAGAGRGIINPPSVVPAASQAPTSNATPRAGIIRRATQATQAAAPAAVAAAPTEANPMDGAMFSTIGPGGPMVQMEDGTQVRGPQAQGIISASNGYFERNPVGAAPVEIVRGPRVTGTDARGNPVFQDTSRSVAVPELRYGEMDAAGFQALSDNGGIGRYTQALAKGQVDAAAPEQAKQEAALAVQALQNQGSAANAAISAGPGYAGVKQRATEAEARLALEREQAVKPVVVGGGQEPVYDSSGMFVGMRTVPGRLYDPKKQQYIDQPGAAPAAKDAVPPGMKKVGTSGGKPVYEDQNGKRFIGG